MAKNIALLLVVFGLGTFSYERPEGFFKHLFMDGGAGLTSRKYFPAGNALADSLKYNFEFIATTDVERTVRVIAGNPSSNFNTVYAPDDNGYMLYPDGTPRYMMVFVNGGSSSSHGIDLTEAGRQNFRDFFRNGGSYIGTCAGAFIAGLYSTSNADHKSQPFYGYFHLWPAYLTDTYIGRSSSSVYPAMSFEDFDSITPGIQNPLLDYADFGGDSHVDWVRHHGGPYFPTNQPIPAGTEILGRYDTAGVSDHGRVALIAYKPDSITGRLILNGCHPEADGAATEPSSTGDRYDLFKAKILYAQAGIGKPRLKSILKNNVPRAMVDNRLPGYEKIGDYQYHHFKINVPESAPFLKVDIEGEEGFPFNLYAYKGSYAFNSVVPSANKEKSRSSNKSMTIGLPEAGEWFVAVELDTSVRDSQGSTYPIYKGALQVLNGVAYTIKASYNSSIPDQHIITATAGSHGTITPSGAVSVYEGGGQIFIMQPDSAYEVDYLTIDGEVANSSLMYGFENIQVDHSIDVKFRERVYYDTFIVDNNGAGTSFSGTWSNVSAINSYGTLAKYNGKAALPTGSYTWSAPIRAQGSYSIEMWWTTATSRLSTIPVVVSDGDTPVDTVYVNQKVNDGKWNMLVSSETFLGDSVKITILHTGSSDSTICADAVRIIGNPRTISGNTSIRTADVSVPNGTGKAAISVGPNPFNPFAKISYYVPVTSPVSLSVYDMNGRKITQIVNEANAKVGRYETFWNGKSERSGDVSSGLYVFRLVIAGKTVQYKAALVK